MNQNMDITVATEEDIPDLADLLALLFSQEVEFTPDHEAQERGLRMIITHPETGFILVGKINGRAMAMVNILFTVSTALGQRVAILEDMFVSPSHRNSGLGSGLLKRAIAEARHHGCLRITLLTDHTNETGQSFYKRHGFVASTMIPFRLSLDPGTPIS